MQPYFEDFMRPAEGSASCHEFFRRAQALGFKLTAKDDLMVRPPYTQAAFDLPALEFEYDPEAFSHFTLFHEMQHLIVFERARELQVALSAVFKSKMRAILEADAYLAEQWLCNRYDFPEEFVNERIELLKSYIHRARTALRNKESLRELATIVCGYDIQSRIEEYFM